MPRMLRLKAPVRVSHSVNTDDVVSVKRALADLGLYDPPAEIHGALDSGMLNGIEAFQRMNKLHVDREVAPGGETERTFNERLFGAAPGGNAQASDRSRGDTRFAAPTVLAGGLTSPGDPGWSDPLAFPAAGPDQRVPPTLQPPDSETGHGAEVPPPPPPTPDREPSPDAILRPEVRPDGRAAIGDPAYGALSNEQGDLYVRSMIDDIPIPAYRNQSQQMQRDWPVWNELMSRRPDIGTAERRALREVFAAEGGFQWNRLANNQPGDTAFAGITRGKIADIADAMGIDPDTSPDQLARPQILEAYHQILNLRSMLGRMGGAAALEQLDSGAAIALADLLFRGGGRGGSDLLRSAIAAVGPDLLEEGAGMTQDVFHAYAALVADPGTRQHVADALAAERARLWPDEDERNTRMHWWLQRQHD